MNQFNSILRESCIDPKFSMIDSLEKNPRSDINNKNFLSFRAEVTIFLLPIDFSQSYAYHFHL